MTGAKLDIREESSRDAAVIAIGNTKFAAAAVKTDRLKEDGYAIVNQGKTWSLQEKALRVPYMPYTPFVEKYLGCRKWYTGAAQAPG